MGSAPIDTLFPLVSLAAVLLIEAGGIALGHSLGISRLWVTGAARLLQAGAVCALAVIHSGRLDIIGFRTSRLQLGLRIGVTWSAGFAVAAALILAGIRLAGYRPLALIHTPLPPGTGERVLFFVIGGILAPVAEEIVFRGVIFGYLQRLGLAAAVLISTALFAAAHPGPALPITQVVGGIVFALAYHASGSLVAPILIHCLGNLAIFTLSLPWISS